jgi:hypothetical protein
MGKKRFFNSHYFLDDKDKWPTLVSVCMKSNICKETRDKSDTDE